MSQPIIGVSIQAGSAAEAVAQVRQAEDAGVQAAWATIGVAGGADAITTFAAALTQTERILPGTSIVQTWPRPPIPLAPAGVAGVAPLVRATALAVLGENYARTARAKGLPELQVIGRHVLRNALLPLVTVIGLSLTTLLEGAFFVELILGIPGIGQLGFQAAQSRDYDIILALVLIVATAFIIANIITDVAYTFIDPRIRFGAQRGQ